MSTVAIAVWSLSGANAATADPCAINTQVVALQPSGPGTAVEYSARVHEEGHRFTVGGVAYELVRTQFIDAQSKRRFAVTYPTISDARKNPDFRDFFVSVETRQIKEPKESVCSDVLYRDQIHDQQSRETQKSTVHRLEVNDHSSSRVEPGDLDRSNKYLVSTRTLAASLRVRVDGTEMVVATGFTAQRSLNISQCANSMDDSYGFVEYQPGQIKVACFPADPKSRNYVDEIDWRVDYQWPSDPPALIDQLIDYVYVDAL